jgi:hypothetical protein
VRLTSAGTGGSAVTPSPYDTADTYSGGAMTLPSSKGAEGANLLSVNVTSPTAGATLSGNQYVWEPGIGSKPIIFGPATSNGIAVKNILANAGGLVMVTIEFTTTSYL